jgi:electron transfer flavoprotein alpha/beta subunit
MVPTFETAAEEALQAILSSHFAMTHADEKDLPAAKESFEAALQMGADALALLEGGE